MKDILRSLRIENNYSQSAVASYLDISRQMYNKYEMGNAEP
ncbi:MAG: helix-turn-helix transcriptional regulator, partial [Treponema sp.]|nr:helix-turn-helix transcriptional regulator [Treponema sp.]